MLCSVGPPSTAHWLCLLLPGLASLAGAHSWCEELRVLAPNGSYVGPAGYPRAFVPRNSPGFSDSAMVNLIPPNGRPTGNQILPSDAMCRPSQKNVDSQTAGFPALQAAAGSMIAIRYQENGHVTLPQNTPGKPANRGTVYIYGTSQPQPTDTLLQIHKVWTADGSGGDKRGRLVASQNFDDGQCYQVNGGNISQARQAEFKHPADQLSGMDLWCQNNIVLPADAPRGKPYTLYWVWDWPTAPQDGNAPAAAGAVKEEIYTSCMDVDVTNDSPMAGQVKVTATDTAQMGVPKILSGLKQSHLSSGTSNSTTSYPSSDAPNPASYPSGGASPPSGGNFNVVSPSPAGSPPAKASSPALPSVITTTVYITLVPMTTTAPTSTGGGAAAFNDVVPTAPAAEATILARDPASSSTTSNASSRPAPLRRSAKFRPRAPPRLRGT